MRVSVLSIVFLWTVNLLFAQEFTERFELVNIGKDVNTHYHEAAPIISPDGNTLYFFVDNHPDNKYGKDGSQDIWVSKKNENGEWGPAEHLKSPFNDSHSNQVFTAFSDGTLFIKGGKGKDEKGFSLVDTKGKKYELNVHGFAGMNKGRFYGASMSADRKHIIMYFSETKNGVMSDLYVSHIQANGNWTTPVKLKISHSLDDFAPFISPDQKTLYYASNRPGDGRQGGADIYKTTRKDGSWEKWSEPVNLGPVINTAAMDAYFSIDKKGNVFLSRANSRIDGGNLDIFTLIERSIKIQLTGVVFDEKTKAIIPAAEVKLTPKDTATVVLQTDANGEFKSTLPEVVGYTLNVSAAGYHPNDKTVTLPTFQKDTNLLVDIYLKPIPKKLILDGSVYNQKTNEKITARLNITVRGSNKVNMDVTAKGTYAKEIKELGWYIITASAEGYLNVTDSIYVPTKDVTPVTKDMYLQPIEVGVTVRLKNVYFDFDKTTLKSESFTELDKVVDFLKKNPSVEIEIAGHTDNKGSDTYNEELSQGRCQSVVDYIISQGIESYRLTAHGYGEAKPIDTNDTDEGRANNRRVEFTVLKK